MRASILGVGGLLLACVACSSSGSPTVRSSGPAANPQPESSAANPPSSSSSAPSSGAAAGGSGGSAGGITFSGSLSGTMSIGLCAGGIGSLDVHVNGDDQTYHGSISAGSFGFVGPNTVVYSLRGSSARPTVTGTTFTVHDATLADLVGGGTVTASGSASCP